MFEAGGKGFQTELAIVKSGTQGAEEKKERRWFEWVRLS